MLLKSNRMFKSVKSLSFYGHNFTVLQASVHSDALDIERVRDKVAVLWTAETSRADSLTISCVTGRCYHCTLTDVLERRAEFTSWKRHQMKMTVLAGLPTNNTSHFAPELCLTWWPWPLTQKSHVHVHFSFTFISEGPRSRIDAPLVLQVFLFLAFVMQFGNVIPVQSAIPASIGLLASSAVWPAFKNACSMYVYPEPWQCSRDNRACFSLQWLGLPLSAPALTKSWVQMHEN